MKKLNQKHNFSLKRQVSIMLQRNGFESVVIGLLSLLLFLKIKIVIHSQSIINHPYMTILLYTLFGVGGYHFGSGVGKMILENKNQNKDE